MKTCQPRVAQTRSSLYKRFVACRLWLVRYGLALGAVGVGVAARRALDAWLGPGLPTFITYYPVVMLVALAGGLGPGLVATPRQRRRRTTGVSILLENSVSRGRWMPQGC